jgi:uncharacterized phage protein (TIGR02218 family)
MADFLMPDLTTIALCWRMVRRDGVALGFTSHDRDLLIQGLSYRAAPGITPSAITLSDGFDAAALDISGALSSEAITEADLMAGRWDGARATVFIVSWEEPEGAQVMLARGELGDVSLQAAGFFAELKGPAAALDRPVVEQTSPECRAELGDKRCRVDLAGRVRLTRVTAMPSETVIEVADAAAGTAYAYGRLRWLTGANSGLERPVLRSNGPALTLREPPHFSGRVGDLVEIAEGCDRSFETCVARFGNGLNFRGEPHLPGMDLLTRYEIG